MTKESFICQDCFKTQSCKEPLEAWVFFLIAIIATISIRAVNLAFNFSPLLSKVFWYLGVVGFFLFFIYKFKYHNRLHREFKKTGIVQKLLSKQPLSEYDYGLLGTVICQLNSKKDKVNFFIIFFFSGLALILAIYFDFIK
ncbi:MAG: hypothetical protein KJ977_01155 [Candidatus Omnitrophica bacterium]|nr:hypothetical protein [Candidatus Omnitrophota bacterium]MBU2251677.1 hypothetical protein [Candidatus Omnitrophota bacterium]MBU2265626.1 hypothetical protein [Candidatus Omnitrophota bacterium]